MFEVELSTAVGPVDFNPADEITEVIQNVRTILNTRRGTVPGDRDFGIGWDFIDQPIAVAQAMISTEVIQQLQRYEPRAKVISIDIRNQSAAQDGQLKPVITIGVNAQ